ncbi:ABC transporter substrate-binding protein [Cellulomonas sp. URHE0023]|uniref:ABC transporter substrate-binding protein n=1 Tax=Cellulomonas sp. URHE0023 TaxID=1380354 RepID=UPI0005525D1C|nr:ABC transporter substrate-binding protein [Cellulomonas sp. URHE0023]
MTVPTRLLVAVASLAVLSACSTAQAGDPSQDRRPVSVILDWTPNTNHSGLYIAQERGYFSDAGLDVTIVQPGDTSGLQLLAAGQADFAYSVAEGLVPAREKGADVVSVAAVIQHNTSSLISLTSAGISRPRDLAGHSYGSYGSELEEALIRTLVSCDGGDPDAVTMPPLASDDFRIGLTEHQFDAAWVFDGWDTIRLRDLDGLDVSTMPFLDHTDCIPDWYTPLVATSQEHIDHDPALVRDFVGALTRGYEDAITDPQAAADAIKEAAPEIDEDLLSRSARWLAPRYTDDPEHWGVQQAQVWDDFVGFLQDNELAPSTFDTDAAWTNDFLPAG